MDVAAKYGCSYVKFAGWQLSAWDVDKNAAVVQQRPRCSSLHAVNYRFDNYAVGRC
jgi:hypothetical protein